MIDALYAASQRGVPDRPHRARHLLPAPAGAGAVGERSGCARSSAASSSTPGCTASAPIPTTPSTSSVRPTSCPATSTVGSRRSRRSPIPGCGRGLAEMLDANLADDTLAWELSADGTLAQDADRGRACPRTARLQELARSRRSRFVPDLTVEHELKFSPGPFFQVPDLDDRRRACAPTRPTRSGCRPSTTTPTTSGSHAPARACATATPKAGR